MTKRELEYDIKKLREELEEAQNFISNLIQKNEASELYRKRVVELIEDALPVCFCDDDLTPEEQIRLIKRILNDGWYVLDREYNLNEDF